MRSLSINQKHICNIPENWNELTAKQLLQLCSLIFTSYDAKSLLIKLMLTITGLRFCQNRNPVLIDAMPHYWLKSGFRKKDLISVDNLGYAASPLQFIFTETDGKIHLTSRLFENKLPVIKVGRTKLYGPDSALFNISFAEFIKLETLYDQYSRRLDDAILDKIIAVLYRRRDKSVNPKSPSFVGDIRVPFNDFLVDDDAAFVSKMKPEYKLAVRLFYEGCRWFIFKGSKLFENAFTEGEGEGSNTPPLHEFNKLVNALSNNDPSKMKDIRMTSTYDIFYQLDGMVARNKNLKNKSDV